MASTCPHCGTNLSITLRSADATDTIITTAVAPAPDQRPREREGANRPTTPPPPYPSDLTIPPAPTFESDLHQPPNPTLPKDPSVHGTRPGPLLRVKHLLCPCPCDCSDLVTTHSSYRAATLRPYLCFGGVGQLARGRPHEALHRAAAKMQATILRGGWDSADVLLAERRPLWTAMEGSKPEDESVVFEAVGAVVYDMEWTAREEAVDHAEVLADAAYTIGPGLREQVQFMFMFTRDIFRIMLLVDYGRPQYPLFDGQGSLPDVYLSSSSQRSMWQSLWWFERFCGLLTATAWRWRQGHGVPDKEAWSLIRDVLLQVKLYINPDFGSVWDTASLLYFYYSHRRSLGAEVHNQGWTGYTGVLQEMIAEVPARGPERLTRKLSLDIYYCIPTFIRDQALQKWMWSAAWRTAHHHGCLIVRARRGQAYRSRAGPGQANSPQAGSSSWWDWVPLSSLFGLSLTRQRLGDEESRGKAPKID